MPVFMDMHGAAGPGSAGDPGPDVRDNGLVGHRVSCPDFVGRAKELELLELTLAAVQEGRPATVFVGGDAGIGKTRLADELSERARHQGAVVATGMCAPADGGGLPYGPVVGILRSIVRQLGEAAAADVLSPTASGLGPLVPGLVGSGDHLPVEGAPTDGLAKTRLFESVLACAVTLARRSVVLLVFEDLQWADSASAELVDFLARNLVETRVLLVGTYRSDELDRHHPFGRLFGELVRHRQVTQIHLDGLDKDEIATALAGILGHRPDWALVEAVYARSGGNPFFAEELTAARDAPTLSDELQGVIMTRVKALSPETQSLLKVVATAGATVDHRLLAEASRMEADGLDRAVAEAVERHILVVDSASDTYQFRHALLREAIYGSLLPGERRRLHRQVASALEAQPQLLPAGPGHEAVELAGHWWAAGEWVEVLDPSIRAAQSATAVMAFPEALPHLEHALAAWDHVPDASTRMGTSRLDLLEWASEVAYLAADGPRSVALAQAAVDAVDVMADPRHAAVCYTRLGRNLWSIHDSEAAFRAYRQAAALLPADPPSLELARVLAEEARGLMLVSRLHDAEARCHEAIAAALAVGARAEEGHALNTLGCCLAGLGRYDEGIGLLREALAIAAEVANPDDLNRAYSNLSELLSEAGQPEEAVTVVDNALATGYLGDMGPTVALIGAATLIRLGRWDQAEDLLSGLGNLIGICGNNVPLVLAPIAVRRGRFDEAARMLATVGEMTDGLFDVQLRGSYHMLQAELALEQGRPGEASDEIERALSLAAGTDDECHVLEICALGVRALADHLGHARAQGRRVDADKVGLAAAALVHDVERLGAARLARGGVCSPRSAALASLCMAEQSRVDRSDPDLWRTAANGWDAAAEPYPAAYSRWREAEAVLQGRAGRSRASECLQDAWRPSVELGAVPLQTKIERLAQRARIVLEPLNVAVPTPGSSLAADLGLTQREVEVLGQLAAGRTDRQIAETLFISKKTASVHVSNLLRKLDVTNRVEAGDIGQTHGLG